MTTWYVARNSSNVIVFASEERQEGYATEQLDDAKDTALQAFLAAARTIAPVKPSPREWLERLSADKQAAIAAAGTANAAVLLWLLKAAGTPQIDVTATETIAGVGALVTAGVITTADQTVLLTP